MNLLLSRAVDHGTRAHVPREPLPGVDVGDYPKLLEALLKRGGKSGRSGLSLSDKAAFDKLIGDWYDADPESATDWVRLIKHSDDLRELGNILITRATAKDYEASVLLMQEFSLNEDGEVVIPEVVMETAALQGTPTLLELSSLSPPSVEINLDTSFPLTYPRDFDFQAALDGFETLHSKGMRPATYPSNLMDEWAKRDPEAALQWLASNEPKAATSSFRSFFYDLANSDSADELTSAMSLALEVGGGNTQMIESIARQFCDDPGSETLARISEMLQRLPDTIDQTALRVALMSYTAWSGPDGAEERESFLQDLRPEERMSVIQQLFGDQSNQWLQESRESLKQTLIAFGHRADEVARMVPDVPQEK